MKFAKRILNNHFLLSSQCGSTVLSCDSLAKNTHIDGLVKGPYPCRCALADLRCEAYGHVIVGHLNIAPNEG